MATKTAILSVKIVSDAADFSKKMDDSAGKLDKFQNAAKKLAVPAAAVIAGIGAIALSAGKMASEAEQNFGAVDAVFKEHSKAVQDMAKNSATNLGLSASDYAKYSALLGSQLKNAGTPMDELAGKTNTLIGYGADFAAQFGGTVPEAVEALSSALKGEMDPIEKYGISLNQAKIDAEASALGFEKVGGAWSESAKQAAIMSLVAKQGGDAMGAFGREAGTAAGQQAIATAKWQDASAQLGSVLLPIMTQAATILADVARWVQENQTLVTVLAVGIGLLAAGILVLNGVMIAMNIIAAVNPWVIIAVAVALLVTGIVLLATKTRFFQDTWAAVSAFVGGAINNVVGFMNNLGASAQNKANEVRNWFVNAWQAVSNKASEIVNGVIGFFSNLGRDAQNKANEVRDGFVNAWNAISNKGSEIVNNITGFFGQIGGAVQGAINWVNQLFNMGGMPGWLSSVLGLGGTGFNITGAFAAPVVGEFGMGTTGGFSGGGGVSRSTTSALDDIFAAKRVLNIEVRADTSKAEYSLTQLEKSLKDRTLFFDIAPKGGGQATAQI